VYWINMNESLDRRIHMENHLSQIWAFHNRVRAVTSSELDIPVILSDYEKCVIHDEFNLKRNYYGNRSAWHSSGKEKNIHLLELCGRPVNRLKELAGLVSHLIAAYNAIHSPSESKYALILEDDVKLKFRINITSLALSAPKDFAVLQLLISNENVINLLWKKYQTSNGKYLWHSRRIRGPKHLDSWCAGAYLINKDFLRPFLDQIIFPLEDGSLEMKIIAGDCATSSE